MTPSRSLSLSILPLALGLGACVGDSGADSGLTVLRAAAPDDECIFAPDGEVFIASGRIDGASLGGYLLAPTVRNDLQTVENEAPTPKTIFVTGARVEVEFYDPDLFSDAEEVGLDSTGVSRFLAPVAGAVDPNGGLAVFPFNAVPPELLVAIHQKLRAQEKVSTVVDVNLRMVGTRGGSEVQSNLFRFPIEICVDCGIIVLGDCGTITGTTPVSLGGACQPFQDGHVDCCLGIDPDSIEVKCEPGEEPPEGKECDDGILEDQPLVCPARPIEM
jgi:hypothetical protein